MTSRITNTLHETAEAVEVPAIDQVAFQQRVRAARRRRVAIRATVAVAASVALAAGVGVVGQWRAADEPGYANNNPGEQRSFESMEKPVPFIVNGNLMVLPLHGKPVSTGFKVEEIVGQTPDGVVVITIHSRVLLIPLDANGEQSGLTQPIIGRGAVQQAILSKDGTTIGWIGLDNVLHLRRIGERAPEFYVEQLTPAAKLASVAADSWVVLPSEGGKLRLATVDGSVDLDSQAGSSGGELAGGTVAAEGFEGVQFFAAPSGDQLSTGGVGGGEGALSPDGSTYVAAASEEEVDRGMTPELAIVDVKTGKRTVIPAPDGLHFTLQITWTGSNFLVSGSGGKHARLYECSAAARSCRVLYTGPRGDLLGLARN